MKKTIAVFGATGAQGGGVVAALRKHDDFRIRALTRNPNSSVEFADEVAAADLTKPDTLLPALEGAYGVFANTNSFAGPDVDEVAQGTAAVTAAKEAGVEHYIWSTLPNVDQISEGRFNVAHFTDKARVNAVVAAANFEHHTFVEPPFYFQNLISPMYQATPRIDGVPTWRQPMDPSVKGMHMGDINELGNVVAGAFVRSDLAGSGDVLSAGGDLLSWAEVISILRSQGHDLAYEQTTEDPFGLADMFAYFEEHTYYGPDAEEKIARAHAVTTEPLTDFATWAAEHMPSASR